VIYKIATLVYAVASTEPDSAGASAAATVLNTPLARYEKALYFTRADELVLIASVGLARRTFLNIVSIEKIKWGITPPYFRE